MRQNIVGLFSLKLVNVHDRIVSNPEPQDAADWTLPTMYNDPSNFGADLRDSASFQDMLARMGADWEALPVPVTTPDGITVPGARAIVRSDNRAPIGMVSDQYKPVQNRELLRPVASLIAESKETPHALKPLCGGVVDGGSKVFARLSLGTPRPIGPAKVGDLVRCDVNVTANHDGTGSAKVRIAPMRLICTNGMAAASGGATYAIPHRGDVQARLDAYRNAIRQAWAEWTRSLTVYNVMANARIPMARRPLHETIRGYVAAVFGPKEMEAQQNARNGQSRRVAAIEQAYQGGRGSRMETTSETGWGLYQALTHYMTHNRTLSERRYMSLADGAAASANQRGLEVAYALSAGGHDIEDVLDPNSTALVRVRETLAQA